MQQITDILQKILDKVTGFLDTYPLVEAWYTTIVRFVFPILAVLILAGMIRSLLNVPHSPEVWGKLALPGGEMVPLTHWENIVGRSAASDVVLSYPSISRQHAALMRAKDGSWAVYDLDSTTGTTVNTLPVDGVAAVSDGDSIAFGGVPCIFVPVTAEERLAQRERRRRAGRPVSPWGSLIVLSLWQALACLQIIIATGENATVKIPLAFAGLCGVMWLYFLFMRAMRRIGFEMEIIAFFLSTLSLCITASSAPGALFKQFLAVCLGLALFVVLGVFLRDLSRVQKIRWMMAACAIGLLGITLVLGASKFGAKNWLSIGGMSFQPSELAKICYIFAGSATLDRLFRKRNLGLFIVLTGVCLGCLALMSDFGTAAIFFVTFLVIAYLRSGDFATLSLISGAAVFGVVMILSFKPYILKRFAVWGHVWEDASGAGYQQTRTMSAAASGGLVGVGGGEGWLHRIGAADTDLVFGMLCEEWGLLIGVLAVLSIVTLAVFAVRACSAGRSSFYIIAACAATSLLVFQTCLNVFGAVDLLPLTGVTFPFLSNGGSSMLSAWGLLAFLKATDTRQNASFAIRLPSRRELRAEVQEVQMHEED
ncbi:MAG: FtsW/RodA/SpoVE family cell cycle protein [Clostridiaceae bacterium]|nr:FtsW/RodA/SpoVE family cell cycle protein [Clostridiaceae bacterium]